MIDVHQRFYSSYKIFWNSYFVCYLSIYIREMNFWLSFAFLKSTCLLLAIFLKFIFNQKETRGFIWPKKFEFYFINNRIFIQKKDLSLKVAVVEFKQY